MVSHREKSPPSQARHKEALEPSPLESRPILDEFVNRVKKPIFAGSRNPKKGSLADRMAAMGITTTLTGYQIYESV